MNAKSANENLTLVAIRNFASVALYGGSQRMV